MAKKRAQITEEKTAKMYEDVLDRLGAQDEEPPRRPSAKPAGRRAAQGKAHKQPRLKRTFYLPHESVLAIDKLQNKEFAKTGKKPELSEIVARAIQLLAKQSDI